MHRFPSILRARETGGADPLDLTRRQRGGILSPVPATNGTGLYLTAAQGCDTESGKDAASLPKSVFLWARGRLREAGLSTRQGVVAPTANALFAPGKSETMKAPTTNQPAAPSPDPGCRAVFDRVYSEWDVNIILGGFARGIMRYAIEVMPDTVTLAGLFGEIADQLNNVPRVFLQAETSDLYYPESEQHRANAPKRPDLEDLDAETVSRAVETLRRRGALNDKGAGIAVFRAMHLAAVDVAELARESDR